MSSKADIIIVNNYTIEDFSYNNNIHRILAYI